MFNVTREYEACVLVNGKPVTEVEHNGRTYIEGRKDSEYELRFKNKTSQNILIVPSVDGLNTLDGEECGVHSNGYVVYAHQTITIPGWKVDNGTAAKFAFKPQDSHYSDDETYAEQMGEDSNQGVIGFMVFREKVVPNFWTTTIFCNSYPTIGGPAITKRGGPTCDSYSANVMNVSGAGGVSQNVGGAGCQTIGAAVGGTSTVSTTEGAWSSTENIVNTVDKVDPDEGKSLGTGFGESTKFDTINVSFQRETPETPDVAFACYYDTIQNLKKQGVPVNAFRRRVKKQRPNPFPMTPAIMPLQGCKTPQNWRK
jgi:hypothetical protein